MRKTSEARKKAKGTQRNSRVKATIEAEPVTNIGPPEELNEEAKAEWNAIVPLLEKEQILTELDRKILMMYCNEVAKYWDYTWQLNRTEALLELTDKTGKVVVNYAKNPLCDLANKALDNATKIGAQFGLTPLARTKISLTSKPKEKTPEAAAEDQYNALVGKMGKQVKMKTA